MDVRTRLSASYREYQRNRSRKDTVVCSDENLRNVLSRASSIRGNQGRPYIKANDGIVSSDLCPCLDIGHLLGSQMDAHNLDCAFHHRSVHIPHRTDIDLDEQMKLHEQDLS